MRVLISGGGIAEFTLAYRLRRYGFEPLVIEQDLALRHDSYRLGFCGTSYGVVERTGVLPALRKRQLPSEDIAYVNASGKRTAHLSIEVMNKVAPNRRMALMHATLEVVLYQAPAKRVEIRYGMTPVAVHTRPETVAVTFQDGTTEFLDLLIGADGAHSQVRRLVFGNDALFWRTLGYAIASCPLVDLYGISHRWKNDVEPVLLVSAYCGVQDSELVAFLMYQTTDEGYISREQWLPHLRQVFAGMGWITQHLLEDVNDLSMILLDTLIQTQMPCWR